MSLQLEKKKKKASPNQMTKVMVQSSLMKPRAKKGQKKNLAQNNQATWAKEIQNKSPKNETLDSRKPFK